VPLADSVVSTVVAYNSLMDFDDMAAALSEAYRVLTPGGALCVCVTHPFVDAGSFEERGGKLRFVVTEPYVESRRVRAEEERSGLRMVFEGWAHPLDAYGRSLDDAGFVLERVREPSPRGDDPGLHRRSQILPLFLFMRARKAQVRGR
jgi:SAM-dependent methyltransferase